MYAIAMQTMHIEDEKTWPKDVIEYLDQFGAVFKSWEIGRRPKRKRLVSGAEYDRFIYGLRAILSRCALRGYHCTRLTDGEIAMIVENGMLPLSGESLRTRISALVRGGIIQQRFAERLLSDHQADDWNRAGKVWFCFYPPRQVDEIGVDHFFRYWGGESLYMSHLIDDGTVEPRLATFGTPCLIEVDVPIARQNVDSWLEDIVARWYLKRRGFRTRESCDHENYATAPIPGANIRRIIKFPSRDFVRLTRCNRWERPLE